METKIKYRIQFESQTEKGHWNPISSIYTGKQAEKSLQVLPIQQCQETQGMEGLQQNTDPCSVLRELRGTLCTGLKLLEPPEKTGLSKVRSHFFVAFLLSAFQEKEDSFSPPPNNHLLWDCLEL